MSVCFKAIDKKVVVRKVRDWEVFRSSDEKELNLANYNCRRVLASLDIDSEYLCGELSLSEMMALINRAKIRSNNTNHLSKHVRKQKVVHGKPCMRDGVIEMRPVRMVEYGIDENYLIEKINLLSNLVDWAKENDFTHIEWS